MTKILLVGAKGYKDYNAVHDALDEYHEKRLICMIMTNDQHNSMPDIMRDWAETHRVMSCQYISHQDRKVIILAKPELIFAFGDIKKRRGLIKASHRARIPILQAVD